jgi:diguanylate cyclase (GGDEF)-like protein
MEEPEAPDGVEAGVPSGDAALLADRHADDVAALHRVASLPPGDPDARLRDLLAAGCDVLGAQRGLVLLRSTTGLVVRAEGGPEPGPWVAGSPLSDPRIDDVLARQATVATLGGPGANHHDAPLGPGSMVACPLWVTGRVAGVIAFCDAPPGQPFTSWELAIVDLVADGASRVLEHEADIRAMVRLESRAQAMIDLMPDPVVRLRRDGQRLADDGDDVMGPFDPTVGARPAGTPTPPDVLDRVRACVAAALDTGSLQTDVYAAGPGAEARRVEARFVPGEGDVVLCIVRDITERHRAELALAEQVAFEALVASISTRLIGCAPQLLDGAIETGLGEIASFFGADAAFIDELSPDGATLRVSHHWARAAGRRPRRRGERVDVTGFGWLAARFERAGHVFVRGPGALPPEVTAQSLVDPEDKGVLWVRLGYGGELVGVLGMTWRTHEPPVSDEVLGLVRFAADAFLGALRRRSVALLADGQAEVFELIARGAPVATALLAARALLARHTLGATVVVATVEERGRLSLVTQPDEDGWVPWFAALEPGLSNPFGQAVITGEPVMVADVTGDPRFGRDAFPEERIRSATILPVRSPRDGKTLAVVGLLGTEPGAPMARPAVRDSVLSLVTVAVERSIDERRLAHQATHDPLTGVGNRAALLDRLEVALARAKRTGRAVAVLFCDLDAFKAVNDRYGHDRGDRLLVEVAERVTRAVRPSDTVCRTGGDEFVVVCEDLADGDQAHAIAERVRRSIEDVPVDIGEALVPVTVSVGVALADLPIDDADRLLRLADLSMYATKQQRSARRTADRRLGEGAGEAAGPGLGAEAGAAAPMGGPGTGSTGAVPGGAGAVPVRRVEPLGADLAAAIEEERLGLVHQPLVGRDGSVAGIESLVRWEHPRYGPIGPERTVAAAATDDLSGPLGRWVRRASLAARRRWLGRLPDGVTVPVHVNVSDAELASPHFVEAVLADLDDAGVGPEALVLEVRERFLADGQHAEVLAGLRAAGVAVLVENAGQGGLPLSELAGLELAGLKLGLGLIGQIREDDPRGVEVVRALVLLALGLGWRTSAVGVETDHQRAVLFGFGVDSVQGRLVAMPMAEPDLAAWLQARR